MALFTSQRSVTLMARVRAGRRFVEPSARANEGRARIVLYSTRRRQVWATPPKRPGTAQTVLATTHEEQTHEHHR